MRTMRCRLAVLLLGVAEATAAARPDSPGSTDMWRYAVNEIVESFDSSGGNFRVHYTRAGVDAVPADDLDQSGVPDYVESVAALYEQVLAFYHDRLGFRRPLDDGKVRDNGGNARFDVYLLDFAGKADGHFQREQCDGDTCEGFMVQENDFAGYGYPSVDVANRILCSHEFFHAVQASYDANESSIVSEGTAVWATEKFDSTLDDFEHFVGGYLDYPDRSLDKPLPGPVDAFSYGSALFFEFLDEHVGGNVIRELWEDCVDGARGVADPDWYTALPVLLARDHATSFASEFYTFAVWNLYTGKRADPMKAWARGDGYPLVKMSPGQPPYRDDTLRIFYASTQYLRLLPAGRTEMTAVVASTQDLAPLRLALAVRRGYEVSDAKLVDVAATGALASVDTTGADELIVLAANTAPGGESLRGTLCVGSPPEVEPCRPAPPMPDAGAEDGPTAPAPPSSGCSIVDGRGGRSRSSGALVCFGLGFALLVVRVRRRGF